MSKPLTPCADCKRLSYGTKCSACARQFNFKGYVPVPKIEPPKESWWLGKNRDEFREVAKVQEQRFKRWSGVTYTPNYSGV